MQQIRIYVDEDAMDTDRVVALRSRGVSVTTVLDTDLFERPDEEQLAFATQVGCSIYTFNVGDFYRLHTSWARLRRDHGGMILAPQQRFSIGEQVRRLLRLRAKITGEGMCNQAEFLSNWG